MKLLFSFVKFALEQRISASGHIYKYLFVELHLLTMTTKGRMTHDHKQNISINKAFVGRPPAEASDISTIIIIIIRRVTLQIRINDEYIMEKRDILMWLKLRRNICQYLFCHVMINDSRQLNTVLDKS